MNQGVQALTITVLGGGVGLRAESESGEGVFGTSNSGSGNGVWGNNTGGGNGVTGTSDTGNAIAGNTVSGVALLGEVASGGSGLALKTVGPVQFDSSLIATIPQGQGSVTVAPVIGEDELPLDLTEQTKVLCTLLGNAGTGRVIQYVAINSSADTFTVHLTGPARVSVPVACFVLN